MARSTVPKRIAGFCDLAVKLGAPEAKVIRPKDVVTAEWVRLKCQYGCGGYGWHLTCPPHSPTPETTRKVLDGYQWAILLHGDEETELRRVGAELERRIFLAGCYKAFAFVCGPCLLCDECALEEGCQHPYQARPAMEAAGIDVFATARAAGFPLEVITTHDCKQNRYALVLIE